MKCLEIEDFRWYKSLVLFGCGDDPYDIDADDLDVKLIPMVLEKALIPKLTGNNITPILVNKSIKKLFTLNTFFNTC